MLAAFFKDASSFLRPKPFSVDTEMLLDCAVIALVCSWKTDPRAVSKIYRNGIFGGKRDEEAEVPLEDFKKTLFNVRNLYRSLIRQLVRLAFDDVTAKVRSNCLFVCLFTGVHVKQLLLFHKSLDAKDLFSVSSHRSCMT